MRRVVVTGIGVVSSIGNNANEVQRPVMPTGGRSFSADEIYRLAEGSGLHYGPKFRLVQDVVMHGGKHLSVQLEAPATYETPFALDPMRLDCAFHGVFAVFPELRAEERGVTYIPVRLDQAALYKPGVLPETANIEILVKTERSILANIYLHGPENELVAVLRGVRSQAIPVRAPHPGGIDDDAMALREKGSGLRAERDVCGAARLRGVEPGAEGRDVPRRRRHACAAFADHVG